MTCGGERKPLHAESTYYLKRRLATFDSVWYPGAFSGPIQTKQTKAREMETSTPTPTPTQLPGHPGSVLMSNLGSFQKAKGGWDIPSGWGDNAVSLRVYLSIQAFRVNLPRLWRLFFLHPEKPPSTVSFLQGLFECRSCVHSLVSHASQGLEVAKRKSCQGMF